jgi:alpha-D-xyloside xylohydrolase
MPYLYRMAVIAHEKGTPVMRPMFFQFPNDLGCKNLDLQYMLGDSLLVAPIFNSEGIGEFYLPEGKWMNLLDNEILDGGRFYSRKYDYLHLPLFVRENTLLPVGACETSPEYDYSKDLTLRYFLPADQQEATAKVPDLSGQTVLTCTALRNGNTITINLSKFEGPIHLEIVLDNDNVIRCELNSAETTIAIP